MCKILTISEIENICGKKASSPHARFYRNHSYYFTWVLLQLHLTANQVSALGMVLGVSSACLFVTGNNLLFMIGSILLFFSVMADYCDGEVARYRKHKNLPDEPLREYGGFFDSLNHVAIPIVFICLSISFIQYHPLFLALGFLAALFHLLNISFFSWAKTVMHILHIDILNNVNHKNSLPINIGVLYSALLIPPFLFICSAIDFIFDVNVTLYLLLFYVLYGMLLLELKLEVREKVKKI